MYLREEVGPGSGPHKMYAVFVRDVKVFEVMFPDSMDDNEVLALGSDKFGFALRNALIGTVRIG